MWSHLTVAAPPGLAGDISNCHDLEQDAEAEGRNQILAPEIAGKHTQRSLQRNHSVSKPRLPNYRFRWRKDQRPRLLSLEPFSAIFRHFIHNPHSRNSRKLTLNELLVAQLYFFESHTA